MDRRVFMKVLGAVPLAAGIPMGSEERVWITLRHLGKDVTERLPAVFRWNAAMTVRFSGIAGLIDESTVYLDEHTIEPFRAKSFEPIQLKEEYTIDLSWDIRRGVRS